MLLQEEREKIAEYGRKMIREGLVKGTGGNISIYNPEKKVAAISPSGMNYFSIEAKDVVVIELDGSVVDGAHKPSSEHRMHSIFYKKRTDILAVVHTHSVNAAALSCMRKGLPPIYYLQIIAGTSTIQCSGYALPGSEQLAEEAYNTMGTQNAALLANHGVITGAITLELAYYMAEQIEFAAELYLKLGARDDLVHPLNDKECQDMNDIFTNVFYGGV